MHSGPHFPCPIPHIRSYAFFFKGYTGLVVTIGAILSLFIVMQLTARIDWGGGRESGEFATEAART